MPPKFEPSSKICEIVQLTPSRKSEVRWAVRQKEVSSTTMSTLSEVSLKKANGFGTST